MQTVSSSSLAASSIKQSVQPTSPSDQPRVLSQLLENGTFLSPSCVRWPIADHFETFKMLRLGEMYRMNERENGYQLSNFKRVTVGGALIACLDMEQTARLVVALAQAPARAEGPYYFSSINGQVLVRRYFDQQFSLLIDSADCLSADGQPLVTASRFFTRTGLPERVATTDLYDVIADLAEKAGVSFYIFGAQETINKAAFDVTRNAYPHLQLKGRSHGYLSAEELDLKIDEINAAAPDILWVSLGVPLEHQFVHRYKNRLKNVKVIKTSGGLLDFVSLAKRRAPRWMQAYGLEWAFRLYLDPRRLFLRYLLTNPIALLLLLTKTSEQIQKSSGYKYSLREDGSTPGRK